MTHHGHDHTIVRSLDLHVISPLTNKFDFCPWRYALDTCTTTCDVTDRLVVTCLWVGWFSLPIKLTVMTVSFTVDVTDILSKCCDKHQ